MRPLKLELQAFGPFVGKQTVDFEKLSRNGIFLIKGTTGSGKTTIFDAMTYALYGGSSGENEKTKVGRNDLEEWRCAQADPSLATYVSFTFSIRNQTYVFTRKLVQNRVRLSPQYEAGQIDDKGNIVPFFNNPKKDDLTRKAEQLIGLTKEQFRQVVLLPQGQFEKFLTAPSSDKEAILQKIFGSERWSEYVQAFFASVSEIKSKLDDEKKEVEQSLREDDVNDLSELNIKNEQLKQKKAENINAHNAFDGNKKQEILNDDLQLFERFKALHDLEKRQNDLLHQKNAIIEKRKQCEEAEKAETLREPIKCYEDAKIAWENRCRALSALNETLTELTSEEATLREAKEKHEKNSPVNDLTKQITNYESKEEVYAKYKTLSESYISLQSDVKKAQADFDSADKVYNDFEETAKCAKEIFDKADLSAKDYRNKYYAGIYGEIATTLIEGEKCPICGSKNHPLPATKLLNSVSKSDVDEKEKDAEEAKTSWQYAEEKRQEAYEFKTSCKTALSDSIAKTEAAVTTLEDVKKALIDGIDDSKALNEKIQELKFQVKRYEEQFSELEKKHTDSLNKLNELKGKYASAKEEQNIAEAAFNDALDKMTAAIKLNGYENYLDIKKFLLEEKTRTKLYEEIVAYNTSCNQIQKDLDAKRIELQGKTEPDNTRFEFRQNEINKENSDFNKSDAEYSALINRLSHKTKKLSEISDHYKKNIHQAESDLAFAKKLRGDTGIGLQRYVLAVMFNQVISEANRMLAKVHGGRYCLFRSDDRVNGNKRGLELKVHDNRSPEKEGRSVSMLSGGEKFLVSLALSIGMSTVAQKSGVQIEALFIDEGFGTLDDRSIQDAMDVLDSVRKGNAMIGIISHVQLLEANIPTHLEVIKSESGSSIKVV